jgi:glycosyltransferase involved in cell wall biosynthesis
MSVSKQVANRATGRTFVKYKNDEPAPNRIEVTRIINNGYNSGNLSPVLSVVIPTLDGYRNGLFPDLLNQIREQSFQDFETIVVKGDPKQGRAINTGVDLARGKYILTLDDDTSLHSKDAFSLLVQVMDNHKNIGIAGGINVIPADAPSFIKRAMCEIPRRSTPRVERITDSDMAEHPLMIMRKEVFKAIGGENELLPRGLDPYLRQKYRDKDLRVVVVPNVFYSHLPPPTVYKLISQFVRNGYQAAFCNKFYPQWVIETPNHHGNRFITKRRFHFRVARFISGMATKAVKGHFVYFVAFMAYAVGFILGYLIQKKNTSA